MTAPMTAERLAEIRRAATEYEDPEAWSPGDVLNLLDEIDRLRALTEPTRGHLINEAASLGAAAVRAREAWERMPYSTPEERRARLRADALACAAQNKATDAWQRVRDAVEAEVPR